jgi:colanic acid/amylovoran biosynthesis glycosyltransferase
VAVKNRADESTQPARAGTGPLLCVSPLEAGKGIDKLLTAVGLLSDDRPALRLEIVGAGPLASALRQQAGALGLEDRIRFRGPLPPAEVRTALRRCAMLVLPCPIEDSYGRFGVSTLLVDAMAAGTPVVTTDVVGVPNMVRSDTTGVLVAHDDAAGLALGIAALLDDPVRAAGIGAAGRRLIARMHGRDVLARYGS